MYRFVGGTQSLLRIFAAAMFMLHGTMKLFGWPSPMPPGFTLAGLPLLAGIIETFGGLLVLLGLFTRPAAFIVSGEMAVAYFKAHNPMGFWPAENHGELAALYCFVFLFIAAAGPGPVSLDRLLFGRHAHERETAVA